MHQSWQLPWMMMYAPLAAFGELLGFHRHFYLNMIPFYFPWTLVVLKKLIHPSCISYLEQINERHFVIK
jgi:hypothetical protein